MQAMLFGEITNFVTQRQVYTLEYVHAAQETRWGCVTTCRLLLTSNRLYKKIQRGGVS